jgi:hypothetical protein
MWVDLAPLVCFGRPEYWGIEVVGRLPLGIGLPSEGPPSEEAQKAQYNVTISLYSGLTGTEGIELIGATRTQRIEVQHDPPVGECSEWEAWHNRRPGAPPTLIVTGKCKFPDESYQAKLRRREPQGINPKDLLLELIVTEEPGWEEMELSLEVRYEEQTDFEYDTVTILPDVVTVPVKVAH